MKRIRRFQREGIVIALQQHLQPLHGCGWRGEFDFPPHSRLRRQCGVMQDVTARAVNIAENQEIGIFCEKSAEGASLCLTAGVA